MGDANDDGVVSADDFASVQRGFCGGPPFCEYTERLAPASRGPDVNLIPEPASCLALVALGAMLLMRRRSLA